jgi:hypothetical protein
MRFRCLLGMHNWTGCKCSRCGKVRDEGHDWSKDCEKCCRCGMTQTHAHRWGENCEQCSECGARRKNAHEWKGCKCPRCGTIRDEEHDWNADCSRCSRCGKTRTDAHTWNGCRCSVCRTARDEGHDWSNDCNKCARCGKIRPLSHDWNENVCVKCGKTRNETRTEPASQGGVDSQHAYRMESLAEELGHRLGSFTVSVFCAQIDSDANAQACYNEFAATANAPPSKTTYFLGELVANSIYPRSGRVPVVGVICHDLSCKAQQESFNWFAGYAADFHGLSSMEIVRVLDRNRSELQQVPIHVHRFRHFD